MVAKTSLALSEGDGYAGARRLGLLAQLEQINALNNVLRDLTARLMEPDPLDDAALVDVCLAIQGVLQHLSETLAQAEDARMSFCICLDRQRGHRKVIADLYDQIPELWLLKRVNKIFQFGRLNSVKNGRYIAWQRAGEAGSAVGGDPLAGLASPAAKFKHEGDSFCGCCFNESAKQRPSASVDSPLFAVDSDKNFFVHNSSSPVGDGCASLCKPTGEGSTSGSDEGVE